MVNQKITTTVDLASSTREKVACVAGVNREGLWEGLWILPYHISLLAGYSMIALTVFYIAVVLKR